MVFVNSFTEFKNILRQHEIDINQKYIVYYSKRPFSQEKLIFSEKMQLQWENSTPFFQFGTRMYICQYGKDINIRKRENYVIRREKKAIEDHIFIKRYKKSHIIKKLDCPASMLVKRIFRMPEYEVPGVLTQYQKRRTSKLIKDKIHDGEILAGDEGYLFTLPFEEDHKNHALGSTEPDEKVRDFISNLVSEGKKNLTIITEQLETYVQQQLLVTDKSQQCFYPNRKSMKNLIKQAKKQVMKDKIDQNNLNETINTWMNLECNIFFRPYSEDLNNEDQQNGGEMNPISSLDSNLLFVYQSNDMQNIYRRYGQNSILLDATYRTSKYALPLYLVIVQTNVNFQIVGIIVTQFKTEESLTEALLQFKNWNSDIIPKYAMVDFDKEEILSVETVFPDIQVYICPFYREQAWIRWVSLKTKRKIPKNDFLAKMRNIASAATLVDVQNAVEMLKSVDYYSTTPLKEYFENMWETEIKRWVLAYEPTDTFFVRSSGVERLNEELTYKYLEDNKNFTLSEMLKLLIENLIPEMFQIYMKKNLIIFESCKYDQNSPNYLYKRPDWLINHILNTSSQLSYQHIDNILELQDNLFQVPSEKDGKFYSVRFNKQHGQCYCTCKDFCFSRLICKHILLVGKKYPDWDIENQLWILDNPIFKLDDTLFENPDTKDNSYKNSESYEICELNTSNVLDVAVESNTDEELECCEELTHLDSNEKNLFNECNTTLQLIQSTMSHASEDGLLKLNNTLKVVLSSLQLFTGKFTKLSVINGEFEINNENRKRKTECNNFVKNFKLKL